MTWKERIEPGIYIGMPEERYFAVEGLSCSGMKQLAVSPLNYWHHNINPDAPTSEETKEQRFGKGAHCRLLEPARFTESYARSPDPADYPDLLVTGDDLKAFLATNGMPVSGKKKQELIDRIEGSGHDHPPIWDSIVAEVEAANAGKIVLKASEWDRLDRLAAVISADDYAAKALSGGVAEVSIFVRDPETGVLLKARMDYVRPASTIDLKSFSNTRGKPIDKAVFDAIFHEKYFMQATSYHKVRELARLALLSGEIDIHGEVPDGWLSSFMENEDHGFGFVFVESDDPFDLRTVFLKPTERPGGQLNVYWNAGTLQVDGLTRLYAEYLERFGDKPWREARVPHVLTDTDLPQLMFS